MRVAIPRIAAVGVVLASLALVLVAPGSARAQSVQGLGYGVGGIAGYSGFFGSRAGSAAHVAGGGELLAGEFGFLLGTDALSITSVNGVFHAVPVRRDEPFSPFVTAGYTHMSSGEGAFDAWNIGGGADVWTSAHRALRLEFRDHVRPDVRGTVHYWSLRAGIAFR